MRSESGRGVVGEQEGVGVELGDVEGAAGLAGSGR